MPRTCPRSLEATAISLPRQKTSDAGSRSEGLQAPPKLMRTPETNAFPSSPSEKQKRIHSPTKSPLKKTKQKRSDVTPMDEGSANPWKTVMNKSARVAGHVAKQLIQGNESDDVWLSDEEMSSDEVKFIKKTNAFVETVDSSSDEDDSVEILGVKNPDKTNYYAKLTTSKTEYNTDKEEEMKKKTMMLALRPAAPTKKLFSTKAMSLTLTSPITMKIAVTYQPPKTSPKNTPFPLEVKCPPMLPLAAPRKNRKRTKTIKMAADAKMEERKETSKRDRRTLDQ